MPKQQTFATISRGELEERYAEESPNNYDRDKGYALVNVLPHEAYEAAHIPHSMNIPKGDENEFDQRFSHDKEVIVYCASPECDASLKVVSRLAERGFARVIDYSAGMSGWQEAGNPVAGE